jgi:hypothetical protein
MFNLNEEQRRVFRVAAVFAFAFWLCNQIADSTLAERVWHQLGILAVGNGAVRACALEGATIRGHREGMQLILTQ